MNQYDNPVFFAEYAKMYRSQLGLAGSDAGRNETAHDAPGESHKVKNKPWKTLPGGVDEWDIFSIMDIL